MVKGGRGYDGDHEERGKEEIHTMADTPLVRGVFSENCAAAALRDIACACPRVCGGKEERRGGKREMRLAGM